MDLVWRNTSGHPVDHLWFHLYLNAFRDKESSYLRERAAEPRGGAEWDSDYPGSLRVNALRREDGTNLWADATRRFECPDDGNTKDATLARVDLAAPVAPGETIALSVDFDSQLPRVLHRTGWAGDPEDPQSLFFMVAQWFPKLAVLGRDGEGLPRWNAHQFHRNTEFFSDYGSYSVTLTVPPGFVVGATGRMAGGPVRLADGRLSTTYVADDVHDFAWTASPHFVEVAFPWTFSSYCAEAPGGIGARVREAAEESARLRGAAAPVPAPEREVLVRLLLQPDHAALADRYRWSVGAALALCAAWYGAYPYPTLTVVDPPAGGTGAGGMEYPTLITVGGDRTAPAYETGLEAVTIHEFAHQYFYGLVGTNEFEQAWLDEGFTSFTDRRVQEIALGAPIARTRYGPIATPRLRPFAPEPVFQRLSHLLRLDALPHPWKRRPTLLPVPAESPLWAYLRDLPPLHFDAFVPSPEPLPTRHSYLASATHDAMDQPGWHFAARTDYRANAYAKPTLMLFALRGMLGEAAFHRAMYGYATRYRFEHPRGADFVSVVREHAAEEARPMVDAFLRAMMESATRLDVAVLGASSARRDDGRHDWTVRVQRRGDLAVAIEVFGEDDAGEVHLLETWRSGGSATTRAVRAVMERPMRCARLGPDWIRHLDADLSNNARVSGGPGDRRPALSLAARLALSVEEVVRSYAGLSR